MSTKVTTSPTALPEAATNPLLPESKLSISPPESKALELQGTGIPSNSEELVKKPMFWVRSCSGTQVHRPRLFCICCYMLLLMCTVGDQGRLWRGFQHRKCPVWSRRRPRNSLQASRPALFRLAPDDAIWGIGKLRNAQHRHG